MTKKWAKNQDKLKATFELLDLEELRQLDYSDLVGMIVKYLYNDENDYFSCNLNEERIYAIDDGDYQGTITFLIPFDTYQPSEGDYLMTYVNYGSCSGCDTLLHIHDLDDRDLMIHDYMELCCHIAANFIRPYNRGWRELEDFDEAEVD
jgi:hypothetical protein